jgi:hypothetical protein
MNPPPQYSDELADRKLLKDLYEFHDSYRQVARDFETLRGVKLFPSMVRLIIEGYKPGKKIRKKLNWPPHEEVPVCRRCGRPHWHDDCEKYEVKPKRNGRPKRKRRKRVLVDLPADIDPKELEAIRGMSKEERARRLLRNDGNRD